MFNEDLSPFFSDFGVNATLDGVAVMGVFDMPYALGAVGVGMAGGQPTFTLPTARVSGDPVGLALVIDELNFVVTAHEPDGTGMSRLILEVA